MTPFPLFPFRIERAIALSNETTYSVTRREYERIRSSDANSDTDYTLYTLDADHYVLVSHSSVDLSWLDLRYNLSTGELTSDDAVIYIFDDPIRHSTAPKAATDAPNAQAQQPVADIQTRIFATYHDVTYYEGIIDFGDDLWIVESGSDETALHAFLSDQTPELARRFRDYRDLANGEDDEMSYSEWLDAYTAQALRIAQQRTAPHERQASADLQRQHQHRTTLIDLEDDGIPF